MARARPGLDRAKRVLDCRAPDTHRGKRAAVAGIRGFDEVFVLPSGDPPFLPCGAAAFESAGLARVRPIAPHLKALLLGGGAMRQRLSRRAAIDIGVMVIGEVGLHEMALRPGTGCIRSGDGRGDAGLVAGKGFEGAEVALVGKYVQVLALQNSLCLRGHLGQKIPVMPLIGDLVRHDEMRLGINNALNIIADMPAMLRACRHCPGIGICERDLPVWCIGQRLVHGQQAFDLLSDAVISAGQMRRPLSPCCAGFLTVDPVCLLNVAADLGFQMGEAAGYLAFGGIPVVRPAHSNQWRSGPHCSRP